MGTTEVKVGTEDRRKVDDLFTGISDRRHSTCFDRLCSSWLWHKRHSKLRTCTCTKKCTRSPVNVVQKLVYNFLFSCEGVWLRIERMWKLASPGAPWSSSSSSRRSTFKHANVALMNARSPFRWPWSICKWHWEQRTCVCAKQQQKSPVSVVEEQMYNLLLNYKGV